MLEVVLENFMYQHFSHTTRERDDDEQARLDLQFTLNNSDIGKITHERLLGASDNVVLSFDYIAELTMESEAV